MSAQGRRLASIVGPTFGLTLLVCLFARPEAGSLVAPLLGPWAGLAYGHSDCTLARTWPVGSAALAVAGLVACVGVLRAEGRRARRVSSALVLLASLTWELGALGSLANTLS